MTSEYTPISFDRMEEYLHLLKKNNSKASDYSFANLWGWAPHYALEWKFDTTLCWIKQKRPEPVYWAPVGPWKDVDDWFAFEEFSSGTVFVRVPHSLCEHWASLFPDKIHVEEDRDNWDYLYSAEELCKLSGNRFHKKKNLWKQFEKNYEYEYRSLSEHCVETVLQMQADWCKWRDCEESDALLAENDAIARVLVHWNDIPGLCGGIIRVDGTPVAYTLAEPLDKETLIIHFEKAHNGIKGGYQAINYLFCNDMGKNFTIINREQDLGDEGLRHAKLSYNPVDFAKKCTVTIL